jgi:peptidyl-dipeptidase A
MRAAVSFFALGCVIATGFAYASGVTGPAVTAKDADAFVREAERQLSDFSVLNARTQWINNTYITEDTDAVAAKVGADGTELAVRLAKEAARFQDVGGLSFDTKRKLDMLRQGIVAARALHQGRGRRAERRSRPGCNSAYGKGKGTLDGKPISGSTSRPRWATERDPDQAQGNVDSWHDNVGTPMKADYARMVDIANQGARELGFKNVGAMWRGAI